MITSKEKTLVAQVRADCPIWHRQVNGNPLVSFDNGEYLYKQLQEIPSIFHCSPLNKGGWGGVGCDIEKANWIINGPVHNWEKYKFDL
jgi:hypothetical protein